MRCSPWILALFVSSALACVGPAPPGALPAGAAVLDPNAEASAGLRRLQQLTAGAEALAAGQPEAALVLLQACDLGLASSADAHFLRGVAHLSLGTLDEALAELRAAQELEPDDITTLCVLARVLRARGELPDAIAALLHAVALAPEDARLRTLLGHLYLQQDELIGAFNALMRAIELDPDEADAHGGLALLFSSTGDSERAEHAWREALRLQPDEPLLLAGLGGTLRDLERSEQALECYLRAAVLEPDSGIHLANAASTLAELERWYESRACFEEAFCLDLSAGGQRAVVHLNFGAVLERLGDIEGAADEYAFAVADDAELGEAHEALAMLCLDRGDERTAHTHLRAALDLGGLSAEALLRLALLHEQRGEREEARQCAELLGDAAAGSDSPDLAFRRAQLLVLSGDPAIHDAAAAIRILRGLLVGEAAGSGAVWNLLGEALATQGSLESAFEAMNRALQTAAPEDPAWAHYRSRRNLYLSGLVER